MNSNEQAKEIVDIWYATHDAKASASDRRALVDEISKAIDATREKTKTDAAAVVMDYASKLDVVEKQITEIALAIKALP